jgi:hypothetical protein
MTPVRTTEQIAPEDILAYTKDLQKLCFEQPTTAELEEALAILPKIKFTLGVWIHSRHLAKAHAEQAAEFQRRFPAHAQALGRYPLVGPVTTSDDEVEALRIERARPAVFNLSDLASPFVQRQRPA